MIEKIDIAVILASFAFGVFVGRFLLSNGTSKIHCKPPPETEKPDIRPGAQVRASASWPDPPKIVSITGDPKSQKPGQFTSGNGKEVKP